MRATICILILLLTTAAVAEDVAKVGASGAQFLKIGVGSRYQAMGEAAVATANDVYAAYWNPAGLVEIENGAVGFTNVNWVLDINLNYVSLARYFEDVGVFAVSAAIMSTGDQEITTFEQEDGTGQFYSAASYAVGLSYARQLTNRFAFGGSVKYIGEEIHKERADGFAFDFGTMLYTGFRSLRLGMSITNMGPDMKFTGPDLDVGYDSQNGGGANTTVPAQLKTTPYDLPMTFRVGVAYDMDMGPKSVLTLASELKHPADNVQQGALGAELSYDEQFFLRGGYKLNYDEEGLTLGGGLNTKISGDTRLVIDYAWQDLGRLEHAQRFSVGFLF